MAKLDQVIAVVIDIRLPQVLLDNPRVPVERRVPGGRDKMGRLAGLPVREICVGE